MLPKKVRPVLLILFAAGIVFFFYSKYRIAPDVKIAEMPFRNFNGSPLDLKMFEGKALLINYWATWCPDCLKEMPSIVSAMNQCDTNSVVFLMVSDEPVEKINAYLAKHDYPMFFVRLEKRLQEFGINTIPTSYLYDAGGKEVFTKVGGAQWDDPAMLNIINQVVEK